MLNLRFALDLAKFMNHYYNALVKEGFSRDDALVIMGNFQFSLLSLTCQYRNTNKGG